MGGAPWSWGRGERDIEEGEARIVGGGEEDKRNLKRRRRGRSVFVGDGVAGRSFSERFWPELDSLRWGKGD